MQDDNLLRDTYTFNLLTKMKRLSEYLYVENIISTPYITYKIDKWKDE